jgi:putative inorganic carbon (hco3(-)) transporter
MSARFAARFDPGALREFAVVAIVLALVLSPAMVDIGMLAWVSLGGLLAFAVVHPHALLLATPFAIPMSFRPFLLGDLQFNVLELLVSGAAIGHAPRIVRFLRQRRSQLSEDPASLLDQFILDRVAAGIAAALLVAALVSIVWMPGFDNLSEALRTFRWTILLPVIFFALAGSFIVRRPYQRVMLLASFVAGSVLAGAIALVDSVLGGGVSADSISRMTGLAPHPNALALVLARAAIPAILVAILFRAEIDRKWALAGGFLALIVLFTFSRGALIALMLGCLTILMLVRARRLAIGGAATAVMAVLAAVAIAPERSLSLLGGGSGSLRIELWSSAIRMIRDNPVTGIGLDQFLNVYLPRYVSPESWPERFTSHPHNVLLDTWLSLGIIGLAVLGMVGALWILRVRVAANQQDRVGLAAAGSLVAVVVHGFVDHSYFLPELAISVWLMIVLLQAPRSDRPESKGEECTSLSPEPQGS